MIPKRLEECRKLIDGIDVRILELLNDRTRVVEEIGRIKQELGLPIYEPRREEDELVIPSRRLQERAIVGLGAEDGDTHGQNFDCGQRTNRWRPSYRPPSAARRA